MFNKQLRQRIESLEYIVTSQLDAFIVLEQQINELVFLKKQHSILRGQMDDLKRKFENLQSRQVNLMNKVEHIK